MQPLSSAGSTRAGSPAASSVVEGSPGQPVGWGPRVGQSASGRCGAESLGRAGRRECAGDGGGSGAGSASLMPARCNRGCALTPASWAALTARQSWRYPVRSRASRRRREPSVSTSSVPRMGWMPAAPAAWVNSTAPYRPLRSQRPSAPNPRRAAAATRARGDADPSRKE